MRKETLNKVGLVALVLLAPGGTILGAGLVWRHFRNKAAERKRAEAAEPESSDEVDG